MAAPLCLFFFFFRAKTAAKATSTITTIIAAIIAKNRFWFNPRIWQFSVSNRLKYEFLFVLKNFLSNKDLEGFEGNSFPKRIKR